MSLPGFFDRKWEYLMLMFGLTLLRLARAVFRSLHDPEFRALLYLLVLILIGGSVFYTSVEGWGALDALFFCVATLSTVGYGDLTPQTSWGKVFTIMYIFMGVGIFASIIGKIALLEIRRSVLQPDQVPDRVAGAEPTD
jgi:voltage-gated potassium channel